MKRLQVINFAKKEAKKQKGPGFFKDYVETWGENLKDSYIHPIVGSSRIRTRNQKFYLRHPEGMKKTNVAVGGTVGGGYGALVGGSVGGAKGALVGGAIGSATGAGLGLLRNYVVRENAKETKKLWTKK